MGRLIFQQITLKRSHWPSSRRSHHHRRALDRRRRRCRRRRRRRRRVNDLRRTKQIHIIRIITCSYNIQSGQYTEKSSKKINENKTRPK